MSEVLSEQIFAIQLGQEFPFFLDRTPTPVPPVSTENPSEVRISREVTINGREAIIYTAIARHNTAYGVEICTPFVVINFRHPHYKDRDLQALIRVGGIEYEASGNGHPPCHLVRTINDPHFFFFESKSGNFLKFIPPIETEGLKKVMSLKLRQIG